MASLHDYLFSSMGVAYLSGLLLTSIALYAVGTAIYNLYFSPLRHIPGPRLASATGLVYALHSRRGTVTQWLRQLHDQYGDVVRVNPTELSFISGETAWPDIYGHRIGKYKNTGPYLKDESWFPKPPNGVYSIIVAGEADHTRVRRNLAHAFSEKALRSQEPLIMSYIDLLIQRLREQSEKGLDVDIMRWYNFATFDIIADLAFGEPLYCLRDSQYHEWIRLVFGSIMGIAVAANRNKNSLIRWFDRAMGLFQDTQASIRARKEFAEKATALVSARLEVETDRPDFFSFILQNQGKDNRALTRAEMNSNAVTFLIAGSETTATTLSGATYLLLQNPSVYARLVKEIRSAFKSDKDINIDTVNNLPYLIATLQEGLRYYPPVPTGFPRVVPGQGQVVSGHYVPGGTSVYVSQHAANHSPRNFTEPDTFAPERWLDEERPAKFEADKREVVQPFSFGPRSCLGKNLAHAELRIILAKILWHFDIELVRPKEEWLKNQRVFVLWEKPSLDITLTPVQR